MRKLARSYNRWTSPMNSARHNLENYAFRTECHARMFCKSLHDGDTDNAIRQAAHLYYYAKQAISAGNLILNDGVPVALVIACEEERLTTEQSSRKALTAEQEAVLTVLRKGAALFGYLDAQLARSGKVKDLYGVLAGMVRDGVIVKFGNGQYALPTAQPKADVLDSLREQYGQAAVEAYLWARANNNAPDSEILAAVVEKAQADARAFDGEAGTLRDLVSERAAVVRSDEELIWNEVAKAA